MPALTDVCRSPAGYLSYRDVLYAASHVTFYISDIKLMRSRRSVTEEQAGFATLQTFQENCRKGEQ